MFVPWPTKGQQKPGLPTSQMEAPGDNVKSPSGTSAFLHISRNCVRKLGSDKQPMRNSGLVGEAFL